MHTPTQHPYDQLTPDRVLDAVESVGFISDARIMTLNSYENRVYQVGIDEAEPVIAKFYRPERWSREQIIEEHRFTLELKSLDLPVVAPIADSNGQTLHEFAGFLFALFPRQGGHAPELDDLDNLLTLGRTLGRIHKLGAVTAFAHRPAISLQRYGVDSVEYLLANGFIPASLTEAYQTLTRDLLHRLDCISQQQNYQAIRVHGDCHGGNILWRNQAPHFVDFDDTCMAPAVQDLWMLLSGSRAEQTIQMAEILDGYSEFMDFNPAELNLIEYLRTLRLLNYSGWLAKRWDDPAFPKAFTWFNTERYWAEHILELREQLAALDEPALSVFGQI